MRSLLVLLAFSALFCLTLIPNETTAAAAKDQDHKEEAHPETHDGAGHDSDHHEAGHPEAEPESKGKDHHDDADDKKEHAAAESEPEPENHSGEDDSNGASNVGFAPAFLLVPFLALVFQR